MSATVPLRETHAVLVARAEAEMRRAEAEPLPHRANIHVAAAQTWLRLAARKSKADATRETVEEP